MKLYHVSSIGDFSDTVILKPGTQNAEGLGVYFSEEIRLTAAEGSRRLGRGIIFSIVATNSEGWWRSKGAKKRFNKARTWHTESKSLKLTGLRIVSYFEGSLVVEPEKWEFI